MAREIYEQAKADRQNMTFLLFYVYEEHHLQWMSYNWALLGSPKIALWTGASQYSE